MRFNMGTQTKVIAIMTAGMRRAMTLSDINLSPWDSQRERRLGKKPRKTKARPMPGITRAHNTSEQPGRNRALGTVDEFEAQFDMLCEEADGVCRTTRLA
jgi:hypothetical protein